MIKIDGFPKLVCRVRIVVLRFKDFHESLGKCVVEVRMANHVPGVASTDFNRRDQVVVIGLDAPFFSGAAGQLGRVACFPFVRREWIRGEVIVGRANIAVAKRFAYYHKRGVVIARCILMIDHDFHSELFLQIEEKLLFVTRNNNDFVDACFLKLTNLSFDQNFATYIEQALRRFV